MYSNHEIFPIPVCYRIEFKLLLFTFKGIHGLAPKYISDMFQVYSNHYSIRRNSTIDDIDYEFGEVIGPINHQNVIYLKVPRTKRVTFEQRSLVVAGPTLWNKLPIHIRCTTDIEVFKNKLKTFYFKLAYNC